jgi:hypothetical protein
MAKGKAWTILWLFLFILDPTYFFKEVVGPRQFLFAGLDSTMNAFRLLERRANFSFKFTPISRYIYT